MPYADLTEFRKDPRLDKIEDLFTVDLIVSYLSRSPQACSADKPCASGPTARLRTCPSYRERSMRWTWIDRFAAFESGKSAIAVKNLSLAEDHFADHFPGFPVMPAPLILEGLAQTGGILVG